MNFLNEVQLKDRWQTAISPMAEKVQVQNDIANKFFIDPINTKYEEIELPTDETGIEIGWDCGKVVSIEDMRPFTRQLGPCLVLLMRGYKAGEKNPSYLSLDHVFFNTESFSKTLDLLINKINQMGSIEVFFSGGYKNNEGTKENIESVQKIISLSKDTFKSIDFKIVDNTFNIAYDRTIYIVDDNKTVRFGKVGISYAGFDKNLNPYQVVDISIPEFSDVSKVTRFGWLNH